MSPATEQVYQAALSLPPSDRFELVQALLAAEQTPPPLDESWLAYAGATTISRVGFGSGDPVTMV